MASNIKGEFFIFDTHDSIGKKYYEKLSIKQVEDKIEEVNIFNYPYLPIARIYKQKEDKLMLIKEREIQLDLNKPPDACL